MMNRKLNQFIYSVKEDLGLLLSISFGVFLFVLFFEPFSLDHFDFNNRLIFVAGLAVIVFVFMVLIRVTYPWLMKNYDQNSDDYIFPSFLGSFILVTLSSLSFAFYLHFVGSVGISFFVMSKVALICLALPIILWLYDSVTDLKLQNELLRKEVGIIQQQVEKYEEDYLNQSIEFVSENTAENLTLQIADVAFIKSADNYVEIVYTEGDVFKKKLLRNTLKNIENQTKPYSNFIRCHRTCIVNMHHIEKLSKNYNNHWLTVKRYDEQLPVSRQYLLRFKEIL